MKRTTRFSGPSPPARLPSLTGLRFVAALTVFGFHLGVTGLVDDGAAGTAMSWVFGQGAVGVSFFFVLSGFMLTWSARDGDTARRFWRRRIAKIYPNHVVTWTIALAGAVATGATVTVTAAIAGPNLLLVQAWFPDPTIYFGMNTVSWSLACEAFFYALFPLLHRAVAGLGARTLWLAAGGAFATVWVVPLAVHLLPAQHHLWAIWLFPVSRAPEFVAGMVLGRIVLGGHWPRFGVAPAAMLTIVAYVASGWLPDDYRLVAGTVVPLGLLVAAVGAGDLAGRGTLLRSRVAVWLGEMSFAFYMIHQIILRLIAKAAGSTHSTLVEVGLAVASLGIAIMASWLLYRFVERPGMRILGPGHIARHRQASPGIAG